VQGRDLLVGLIEIVGLIGMCHIEEVGLIDIGIG
jgi:hypothetical protein